MQRKAARTALPCFRCPDGLVLLLIGASLYFASTQSAKRVLTPSPQFLLDAHRDHGIDLGRSFMVGDKLTDLECGWNAGVQKSILVKTGYGNALVDDPNADLDLHDFTDMVQNFRGTHMATSLQVTIVFQLMIGEGGDSR